MFDILHPRAFLLAAGLASGIWVDYAASAERLPSYGAMLSDTSISGISSGAAMALQFHIAYSSTVIGVRIIAGIP